MEPVGHDVDSEQVSLTQCHCRFTQPSALSPCASAATAEAPRAFLHWGLRSAASWLQLTAEREQDDLVSGVPGAPRPLNGTVMVREEALWRQFLAHSARGGTLQHSQMRSRCDRATPLERLCPPPNFLHVTQCENETKKRGFKGRNGGAQIGLVAGAC